jgi:hypothetical protein
MMKEYDIRFEQLSFLLRMNFRAKFHYAQQKFFLINGVKESGLTNVCKYDIQPETNVVVFDALLGHPPAQHLKNLETQIPESRKCSNGLYKNVFNVFRICPGSSENG